MVHDLPTYAQACMRLEQGMALPAWWGTHVWSRPHVGVCGDRRVCVCVCGWLHVLVSNCHFLEARGPGKEQRLVRRVERDMLLVGLATSFEVEAAGQMGK